MKNPILLSLLFILMTVGSTAQDPQQRPPGNPPPPPPDDRGEILRDLNLSQEQFRTIRRLLGENQPRVRAARLEFEDAQDALDDAIYADKVDEALVQTLTKRSADAQMTLMRLRMENEFAIRRVLTPEQVTKFRELREQQRLRKLIQERNRPRQDGAPRDGPPRDGRGPLRPNGRPGGPPPQAQPVNNMSPDKDKRKPL